ncbi:MAG: DNA/RNA nuclease SfsA, partial [Oscillospiraceae bacterium]
TQRGLKHVNELIKAKQDGYFSFIIFVIQTTTLKNEYFTPNVATDSEFAQALKSAEKSGVKILCYDCDVTLDEMKILKEVTVKL